MVSRPRRITGVPRSSASVPFALAMALLLTACTSGAHGRPGASGVGDPYFPKAGNGGYDARHYALTLSYEPKTRHLTGEAVISARATQDLGAFDLDLKGLRVESVTVDGHTADHHRTGQELTVRPHDDLPEGSDFRVVVRYAGTPETITDEDDAKEGWLPTADGALALGEPVGSMAWFPGSHHPSDKATYDIAVTVPKGLRAVSNGELRGTTTDGNGKRTTYRWHTAEPMASYLATVAIGDFDIGRSRTKSGLPVYTAVDPGQAGASAEVLSRLPDIVEWETRRFGPYPFSSTGAIVAEAENVGYALETQNRPVFPGAPDTGTLVHELAHQWYGDSVTPESWRDMWLNEGFATYAEWLWEEDHGGDTADAVFDALYAADPAADPEAKARWAFPPAKPSGAAHISDSPVYERGAMVLHKVRETVGDDTFFALLKGWAAAHRHGNADTADFTAYVERQAPDKDLAPVWRDWLYGEGKPAER
ncbi:M1 family metallopeptidase [Streptomyces sp. NPDC059785]|uniref:M1 family metallopeptidase n=1 Tax=unclassified Streptomyces TaxID=2593676 RepID=UPI0036594966